MAEVEIRRPIPSPRDLLDLTGSVAVVTGASGGIGAGIAIRFAAAGAAVLVHYRSGALGAADVVAQIVAAGGAGEAVSAELTDERSVEAMMLRAAERFGPVDILINNAGQNFPLHPIADISIDEWRAMYRDNVESMFLCTRSVIAAMRERGGGAIVNVGSISASNPATDHRPILRMSLMAICAAVLSWSSMVRRLHIMLCRIIGTCTSK